MSELLYLIYASLTGGLVTAAGIIALFLVRLDARHKLETIDGMER